MTEQGSSGLVGHVPCRRHDHVRLQPRRALLASSL
jgi:hypothetical protein